MRGRFSAAQFRSKRYATLLQSGKAAVVTPIALEKPLARVDGVAYEELSAEVRSVLAVDRSTNPLIKYFNGWDCPPVTIPLSWVARARTEFGICPGCVLHEPAVRKSCGHDFENGRTVAPKRWDELPERITRAEDGA